MGTPAPAEAKPVPPPSNENAKEQQELVSMLFPEDAMELEGGLETVAQGDVPQKAAEGKDTEKVEAEAASNEETQENPAERLVEAAALNEEAEKENRKDDAHNKEKQIVEEEERNIQKKKDDTKEKEANEIKEEKVKGKEEVCAGKEPQKNEDIAEEVDTAAECEDEPAAAGSEEEDEDDEDVSSEEEREGVASDSEKGSKSADVDSKKANETKAKTKCPTLVKPRAKKSKVVLNIKYDPLADAGWKQGEPVPYAALARTFSLIEGISGRYAKVEHLANFFRSVVFLTPQDLVPAIYLSIGRLGPDYTGIELGVGESILIKAVADATGRTAARVKADLATMGDIGKVAMASKHTTRTMFAPPLLTVVNVFKTFQNIATSEGLSSRNKKLDLIGRMLVACRDNEAQYIMRTLRGKFRLGISEKSVVAALARAVAQTPPKSHLKGGEPILDYKKVKASEFEKKFNLVHERLTTAMSEQPNFEDVVPVLLSEDGIDQLPLKCHIRPGIPIHPMLAQPTKGITEILDRLEKLTFTCEYKYDGERAQVHCTDDGTVSIFSRHLENNTGKFPDLLENIKKSAKPGVRSFILDCEAVAWDLVEKKLLPFQVLAHRARKAVKLDDVKIKVCMFSFDILFLNGESLLKRTLNERRQILWQSFTPIEGEFAFATYKNIVDTADMQPFFQEAVQQQCEGLMVKTLNTESEYVPAYRSYNWLKLKKDYMAGMGDSLDLVPIAAWYGSGKRTGVYGAYLIACYDEDTEELQAMTKVATGLSDADLELLHGQLKQTVIPQPRPYYRIAPAMKTPDVWLDATQVWEVKGADLTISPAYTAAVGLVDGDKGVSLRFPRFLRVRDDKKTEDATNSAQVEAMYKRQALCIKASAKHGPPRY
eukprot:TRINITY_DN3032_c0_g1_i1.p1 TRINITY_DN3032_c0_g1~~TRINITY_DN3032_c0_g1_i1.p1  ORF type:complete len:883 (-),score=260.58 TRINITY_DN3032_c0_g1_i1:76-2724(-)